MITKESIRELQKVDCNCNDCSYLFRLLDKQNSVILNDKTQQQDSFDLVKNRKINNARKDIANLESHRSLIKNADKKIEGKFEYLKLLERSKHGYQGQRTPIQYGVCCKFKKEITFIPNIIQVETQKCFIHRKELTP